MCKFVVSMIICLNVNFHYNGCDLNKRGVVWVWSSFVTPLLKSLPTPLKSPEFSPALGLIVFREKSVDTNLR